MGEQGFEDALGWAEGQQLPSGEEAMGYDGLAGEESVQSPPS